jgi:hypothetical protein
LRTCLQCNVVESYSRLSDMPPVTAFLLGVANSRATLINSLIEEMLAILEERKEMSNAADSATLLVLVGTLATDPASKASK